MVSQDSCQLLDTYFWSNLFYLKKIEWTPLAYMVKLLNRLFKTFNIESKTGQIFLIVLLYKFCSNDIDLCNALWYALCNCAFLHCPTLFPNCQPLQTSSPIKICPKPQVSHYLSQGVFPASLNMKCLHMSIGSAWYLHHHITHYITWLIIYIYRPLLPF